MQRSTRWKLPLAIAALVAVGGIASVSLAEGMGKHGGWHGFWGRMMLTELDADKDGAVTRAEIEAHQAARVAEIDADKNGAISAEELSAHHERMRQKHMAERLKAMDANADGSVSVDEFQAAHAWRMARLDRNGDGQIDAYEMWPHGGDRHHP
jgi:hypothetical protein